MNRLINRACLVVATVALALTGCGGAGPQSAGSPATPVGSTSVSVSPSADRPYDVVVPTGYDGTKPVPLLILLHGYTTTGDQMSSYFSMRAVAESKGFLYVHPDGTKDASGAQFWNATDACCNQDGSTVDDSAYLAGIIRDVSSHYRVDATRVYLFGVSNGGFMAYRMACDHADLIAGIVSMAGATYLDASRCTPSRPVTVLEIHGTADETVPYGGGALLGPAFPSAPDTVAQWADHDGCAATRVTTGPRLDLAVDVAGAETVVSGFRGCTHSTAVQLWTVNGVDHIFPFTDALVPDAIDFLLAHPQR
jgi:polyhydroxybutyrate depolymerase